MRLDDVVAQMLALPPEDRAKIVARLQASLAEHDRDTTAAGVAAGASSRSRRHGSRTLGP